MTTPQYLAQEKGRPKPARFGFRISPISSLIIDDAGDRKARVSPARLDGITAAAHDANGFLTGLRSERGF